MAEGPYRAPAHAEELDGASSHGELDVAFALLPLFGALVARLAVAFSRGERLGPEPTVALLALAVVTLVLAGAASATLRSRIKKG